MRNNFDIANRQDLAEMAEIENEHFNGYERAFTKDFLEKWYNHNSNMFFVVRDKNNEVSAFIILVPVKKPLYELLLEGTVSDLFDFDEDLVCTDMNSDYYYIADICMSQKKSNMKVGAQLMFGAAKIIYTYAKYVTASPITNMGLRLLQGLGFKKVSEQEYNGEIYPVFELDMNDETVFRKKFIKNKIGD